MNPASVKSPPLSNPNRDPGELGTTPYSIVPTACQYCVVGCGYEAHVWEPGYRDTTTNGDPGSRDDSIRPEQGLWVSPAMTGRVTVDGVGRIAAILPDLKCPMSKGNHSPRGGTMGRDLVSVGDQLDSVKERLTTPWLRTSAGWKSLTPDEAFKLIAKLVLAATGAQKKEGALHFTKPGGLGVKMFEYGSLENTYAATKLFFRLIGTPNVAFHDRPSVASNTQGFDDSGMDAHGYNYADIWASDVLFLAGSNPYETQSVFFMQQMTGKRIIVLDPRRTITADYAEKTGGLHLQPTVLGADVAVINALCHYIVTKRRENRKRNKQSRAYPYNRTPRRNVPKALGFLRSLYFQHVSARYSGM